MSGEVKEYENKNSYRSVIGSLMYAMLGTRPDIATAVSLLSRYQNAPYSEHWTAVKRVLRYLNGTRDHGLIYNYEHQKQLNLEAYCDSSHGSDLDDGKSTTGWIFLLNGTPISWSSKKQTVPSSSSTESEYVALHSASSEALWIRNLLEELKFEQKEATTLFCDSQGAISLAKNPGLHSRAKHIELKYHVIRNRIERGKVKVEFVPSLKQLADILTKPLPAAQYKELRQSINVRNV
jgi:hypothetical protein